MSSYLHHPFCNSIVSFSFSCVSCFDMIPHFPLNNCFVLFGQMIEVNSNLRSEIEFCCSKIVYDIILIRFVFSLKCGNQFEQFLLDYLYEKNQIRGVLMLRVKNSSFYSSVPKLTLYKIFSMSKLLHSH